MSLSALSSIIAKSDNAYLILLLSVLGIGIFLFREIVKLRKEVSQIATEKFIDRKNAVLELFKTLDELKKHNIPEIELKAIKDQFLRDLNFKISTLPNGDPKSGRAQSRIAKQVQRSDTTYIPENVLSMTAGERRSSFFSSLFLFGFLTVWAAGWGSGMTFYTIAVLYSQYEPLSKAFSEFHLFDMIWRGLALLFGIAVYVGICVVPVVLALGGVVGGVLGMIVAIKPSIAVHDKVRDLAKKLPRWAK